MSQILDFFMRFRKSNTNRLFLKRFKDKRVNSTVNESTLKDYKKHNKKKDKVLCFAPFKNMYFSRYGDVYVCCHNRNYSIGRYPHQKIIDIWKSDKVNEIRKFIYNDNLSLGCQICQLDLERKLFSEVKANHFNQLPFHTEYPSMMEFELDITCNLECTMCTGEFSSSIRKNREKIEPFKTVYGDEFVEQLTEFIPHLSETRFSGGEPFLIPVYINIWERIVEINPNCLISLQTNGTVFNQKIKAILEKGKFEIGVSLDSLKKDIYESIRVNAKHETVMQNIEYFASYCKRKKTAFRLSMCVMTNNWKEMPQYIELCNKYDAYASFHKVSQPIELGIRYLSGAKLNEIYSFLKEYRFSSHFKSYESQQNLKHYYSYVEQIRIWRDIQLRNEKKPVNTVETLKKHLFQEMKTTLKNDVDITLQKLEKLINSYSEDSQMKLLNELIKADIAIIIQRIQFYSENQLKKEIQTLYGIYE